MSIYAYGEVDGTPYLTMEYVEGESLSDRLRRQGRFEVPEALRIIKQTLESRQDLLISGFGKFSVREKGRRRGRNPATGDELMLSPRQVVTFKCSGKLRDQINR